MSTKNFRDRLEKGESTEMEQNSFRSDESGLSSTRNSDGRLLSNKESEGDLSSTVYVANSKGSLRIPSFSFLNESNFTLMKTNRTDGVSLLRGPRRVIRLCLFALVVPTIFVAVPLYMRVVLYPPETFSMAPTDQRLINRRISTVWCQSQSIQMNGSFNAYLVPDHPETSKERQKHTMLEHLRMDEDQKEYWGFYLYAGSTVTLSSCTRFDGGQLMVLRGTENLRRCAWIGEEDSREEDDYVSSAEVEQQTLYVESFGKERVATDFLGKFNMKKANSVPKGNQGQSKFPFLTSGVTPKNLSSTERKGHLEDLIKMAVKISKNKTELLNTLRRHGGSYELNSTGVLGMSGKADAKSSSNTANFVAFSQLEGNKPDVTLFRNGNMSTIKPPAVLEHVKVKNTSNDGKDNPLASNVRSWKRNTNKKQRRRKKHGRFRNRKTIKELTGLTDGIKGKVSQFDLASQTKTRQRRNINEEELDGAFEELDSEETDISKKFRSSRLYDIRTKPYMSKPHIPTEKSLSEWIIPAGVVYERGYFNQSSVNDSSFEEQRSSYSSSEEALASCEGVILALPLLADTRCYDYQRLDSNKITYNIPVTGTYYFVFSSDNEIVKNDIYLNITLQKIVYDTSYSQQLCLNKTTCSLPLSFWSGDQTVVEVPETGDWKSAYVLDTVCEPRVPLYLTFILLVPIFILFCALQ